MKAIHHLIIACAVWAAAVPPQAFAQVPQIINYQGRISVGALPFTGSGQFRFALVDGTGATSYWSNDATSTAGSQPAAAVSLPVVNGLYVVPLGDTALPNMSAVPATVFANSDVRLRVWFADGSNPVELLAPDQRITSVGYAMVAAVADQVKHQAVTTAMLADQAVTAGKIAGGAITSGAMAPASVTSSIIADGSITPSKLAGNSVSGSVIADGSIDKPDLAAPVATSLVPPGTILPYGGTTAPAGYLMCDGQSYSQSSYSALFGIIGKSCGGTTTNFNVPDLRGRFLRGVDGSNSRDPDRNSRTAMNSGGNTGNAVGSVQTDAFESHSHPIDDPGHSHKLFAGGTASQNPAITNASANGAIYGPTASAVTNITILSSGDNETRPINAYVNFIIKY